MIDSYWYVLLSILTRVYSYKLLQSEDVNFQMKSSSLPSQLRTRLHFSSNRVVH